MTKTAIYVKGNDYDLFSDLISKTIRIAACCIVFWSKIKDFNTTIVSDILNAFDSSLYEENDMFVSEEEFVFDFLNNSKIKGFLSLT